MADKKPEVSRWAVIYPAYINKKKTIHEGRRIPIERACENPTVAEIEKVAKYLGFECVIEPNKMYPRDFMQFGRVRVRIKQEDGTPVNQEIRSKKHLMLKLGELIPQLASRAQESASTGGGKKKKGRGR